MSKTTYTIDDLDHYWMADGIPLFIANRDDICDIVESIGFSIYYLLGNQEKTVNSTSNNNKTDNKTAPNTQPYVPVININSQIYKVVNNFIGRSVSLASPAFDNQFVSIEESATYDMPYIPHVLIDKLDQFFRLVDAQHGTESIVMLTYDTTKQGPEGWGILVPDQTNTSTHCSYDPHSIAEVKPDDVMIVGSVHSHPGMSAYASGTDHKDQADFDGLHITFGWQKSINNNATQYHIEMQMSGKSYTLKPEDVFEDYVVDKEPDPEVVGWTDKVKKVSPPNMGGTTRTINSPQEYRTTGKAIQGYIPHGTQDNSGVTPYTSSKWKSTLPHFDIEDNAIVIAEVDFTSNVTVFCPGCGAVIDHIDGYNSCCEFCDLPLAQKNEHLSVIIDDIAYYCYQHRLSTDIPAYLWCIDETGCHFVIKLTSSTIKEELNNVSISPEYYKNSPISLIEEDSDFSNDFFEHDGIKYSADDIIDFEDYTKDVYVYDHDSACHSCDNYYTNQCPPYKDLISQYIQNRSIDAKLFQSSIDDIGCHMFEVSESFNNIGVNYNE